MSQEEEASSKPPVEQLLLSFEEHAEITDHINRISVAPNDECIVCGSRDNSVAATIYRVDVSTDPLIIGGSHQPLVSTVCKNCGFVRFFNKMALDRLIAAYNEGQNQEGEKGGGDGGSSI